MCRALRQGPLQIQQDGEVAAGSVLFQGEELGGVDLHDEFHGHAGGPGAQRHEGGQDGADPADAFNCPKLSAEREVVDAVGDVAWFDVDADGQAVRTEAGQQSHGSNAVLLWRPQPELGAVLEFHLRNHPAASCRSE